MAGMSLPPEPAVAAEPTIVQVGLRSVCPRCGAKTLYVGMIKFAPRCTVCGLDFDAFNVGDGPAAFLTLILAVIASLRVAKGMLLASEYRNHAREGRVSVIDEPRP